MEKVMRKVSKIWTTIIACILLVTLCIPTGAQVKAATSKYDNYDMILTSNELTIYVGKVTEYPVYFLEGGEFKILGCKLKSSDESIVKVVDFRNKQNGLEGVKEGTANVKLSSTKSKKTLTCKVTVKYAELFSIVGTKVYAGNTYNMEIKGNVTGTGTQYISSDEKIATVIKDGVVKTLTPGKVTISCVGDDGKTYQCELTVQKPELNYTKLTTYYYTGFQKGSYTHVKLVAAGIQVKKFTSSNKKVAIVDKYGVISSIGVGKCTITCTAKNGKIYKCALTVEGGKPWGGLYNGYTITKSKLKTLELYKKLNKVYDYGDAISVAYSYNRAKDGTDIKDKEVEANVESWVYYYLLLEERYPNRIVLSSGGDFLMVKNNDGSPNRSIRFITFYVK